MRYRAFARDRCSVSSTLEIHQHKVLQGEAMRLMGSYWPGPDNPSAGLIHARDYGLESPAQYCQSYHDVVIEAQDSLRIFGRDMSRCQTERDTPLGVRWRPM